MESREDRILLEYALLAFGLCGLIGVLVDLDHPFAYYILGRRVDDSQRYLHKPILIASILSICLLGAYIGRLLVV